MSIPRKATDRMPPMHAGEILREEFMKPLKLSSNKLALELRVPATRISEIVNEKRGITTDTALRLATYFGTSPEFWLNLQAAYELSLAEDSLLPLIQKEVRRRENVGHKQQVKRSA
ncbi:MAG: HigA family addiction module antitoxin [Acidobacteriaceae bacterium]